MIDTYQSPSSCASLSHRSHSSEEYRPHNHLHVCVLSNDDGIVSTEFQNVLPKSLLYLNSNLLTNLNTSEWCILYKQVLDSEKARLCVCACAAANTSSCEQTESLTGFYLGQNFWGGNRRKGWTNGSPWWPKGVGEGEGCISSCANRGKLKHIFLSKLSKSHLSNSLGDV